MARFREGVGVSEKGPPARRIRTSSPRSRRHHWRTITPVFSRPLDRLARPPRCVFSLTRPGAFYIESTIAGRASRGRRPFLFSGRASRALSFAERNGPVDLADPCRPYASRRRGPSSTGEGAWLVFADAASAISTSARASRANAVWAPPSAQSSPPWSSRRDKSLASPRPPVPGSPKRRAPAAAAWWSPTFALPGVLHGTREREGQRGRFQDWRGAGQLVVNGRPKRFRILTFDGAFHGRTRSPPSAGGRAEEVPFEARPERPRARQRSLSGHHERSCRGDYARDARS